MPQEISTTVYQYDELPTEKAKQKALQWGYEITADHGWWEYIYEEAKELGCKISSFDLGRSREIDLKFVDSACEVADKILKNHGEDCDTYKAAKSFLIDLAEMVEKYSDGTKLDTVTEENAHDFDNECDELEKQFEKSLGRCYLKLLDNEFEFITSEENIVEHLNANEYTFTETGKRFG